MEQARSAPQGITAKGPARQPKTMGGAAVGKKADTDSSDAICSALVDIMWLIGTKPNTWCIRCKDSHLCVMTTSAQLTPLTPSVILRR